MFRPIPKSYIELILDKKLSTVKLYTIQHRNVLDIISRTNIHIQQEKDTMFMNTSYWEEGHNAYSWIKNKGKFKNYPIWATLKSQLKKKKDSTISKEIDKEYVEITFEKSVNDILLSDYESWHSVLNNDYCYQNDDDYDINYPQEEIIKSWDYCLDMRKNKSSMVQVCTNNIQRIEILRVTDLKKNLMEF